MPKAKGLFRISRKGGGGPFAGGGYPFLTRFPRGGTKILRRLRGGVSIFYTHKKRNRTKQISLSHNSPAALDAPYARFAPAALKSSRHPGGGYPFLTATPRGGYQNLTETPRGGVCVFKGHFS